MKSSKMIILGGLIFATAAIFSTSSIVNSIVQFPLLTFMPEFADDYFTIVIYLILLFLNGAMWTWVLSRIFNSRDRGSNLNIFFKSGLVIMGLIFLLTVVKSRLPDFPGAFFTIFDLSYVVLLVFLFGVGLPLLALGIVRHFAKNQENTIAPPKEQRLSHIYLILAILVVAVPVISFIIFVLKSFYII